MKKSFAIFIIVSLMLGSFLSVHPDKNGRMSYNSYSLEKEILYLLREEQFELLGNEGSVLYWILIRLFMMLTIRNTL